MKPETVNRVWYELPRMSELTDYLQSMPSHELTKRIATEISEQAFVTNPRRLVIEEFIVLAKQFMQEFYQEIRPNLEKHAYNYPFITLRIPRVTYDSTDGRISYEKLQALVRKIPRIRRGLMPRPIEDPVVPIVLPGVDYSAESLISSQCLVGEELPDKSRLGWQHLDAYADYCLGVMALGRETYASLTDAWFYGNDSDAYFKALETISEEMLHHVSDEIAGPHYSRRAVDYEHYWMKSYGDFPEKVDIALLRLKDEYLGRLRRELSFPAARKETERIKPSAKQISEVIQ
jgi:hypothetical protein